MFLDRCLSCARRCDDRPVHRDLWRFRHKVTALSGPTGAGVCAYSAHQILKMMRYVEGDSASKSVCWDPIAAA